MIDGDQRQACVAHSFEQAVQRCLIDYRAAEPCRTIGFRGDGETLEPGTPPGGQVAGNANLVDEWFVDEGIVESGVCDMTLCLLLSAQVIYRKAGIVG